MSHNVELVIVAEAYGWPDDELSSLETFLEADDIDSVIDCVLGYCAKALLMAEGEAPSSHKAPEVRQMRYDFLQILPDIIKGEPRDD